MLLENYKGHEIHKPTPSQRSRAVHSRLFVVVAGKVVKQTYFKAYSRELFRKAERKIKNWIDKQNQKQNEH